MTASRTLEKALARARIARFERTSFLYAASAPPYFLARNSSAESRAKPVAIGQSQELLLRARGQDGEGALEGLFGRRLSRKKSDVLRILKRAGGALDNRGEPLCSRGA